MRLIATSDTHYVPTLHIPDGDVFIHAGDLMQDGYPDEWKERVDWLASLPHKIKIYVPGNHDFHMQVYPGPALQNLRKAGVVVVGLPGNNQYTTYRLPNGMSILGLPFVVNLPRWAFDIDENILAKYLCNLQARYDIIVSHSPILGVLDVPHRGEESAGIEAYTKYFTSLVTQGKQPKVWISGHIHEAYGEAALSSCHFYNVSMCNREYVHTNPPKVIDL